MYITVKVRVSFHWTLFALCSLCVCVHVLVCSQRPSSAVWSGVQMVELGPAEGERLSVLVSFPLPYFCSLSSPFLCTVSLSSYTPDYLLSFITASAESHLWAEESFSALSFPVPFIFTRLSGLGAAAIHGGFGMKCLLTEPCAPELR